MYKNLTQQDALFLQKLAEELLTSKLCMQKNSHLLSPAIGRRPWSGDYKTLSIRACIRSSRFYINLNMSFIYKDIFSKCAGNIYG